MFLFLDVASPIPEFYIIKDKKIIDSIKIVNDKDFKLSDKIIPTYLEINKKYNLSKNINKLIITIGPGSYTALRVGAAFIAGLSQSMNLPVSVISNEIIYKYLTNLNNQIAIFFESSNNQKFFVYKKDQTFFHEKIENENYILPKSIDFIFYNFILPKFFEKKIKSSLFSIKNIVLNNLSDLEFSKNLIIKPTYISNNSLLN
jgi:tRNA A37 threonylcarbamoyladenosine modification protein TsaB